MRVYSIRGENRKGLTFIENNGRFYQTQCLGLPCLSDTEFLECSGTFFLHTSLGRFEANRFCLCNVVQKDSALHVTQKTVGEEYLLKTTFQADRDTGVISRIDCLTNCMASSDVIYACLPRIALQGECYELYGEASGWCMENQGKWLSLEMGGIVLGNTAGRSTDTAAPFACIRQKQTGVSAAIHVIPTGDWTIQAHRVAESGTRLVYTILEAGLASRNLHMTIEAGETIELPEILFLGFTGNVEACCEPFQRYLLSRYQRNRITDPVYNTWFFDFDLIEPERLRQQVIAAKKLGCVNFVVDAGWFGKGTDWANQVGCWEECRERAFCGDMKTFSDFVRANGMGFGLWMEPERACVNTDVYQNHPDWFIEADTIIYDLTKSDVRDYLCKTLKWLVDTYQLAWMKLDFNSNFFRDRTGSNFYRYYCAERLFMQRVIQENPRCVFEGCSGGGLRSDFHNALTNYSGHFLSDSVHPFESLRMRQGVAMRMLPAYTGAWLVLHEIPFGIGSYSKHNRETRSKVYACGDAWWEQTVDVSPEFAVKQILMGEIGISGDLTSYSDETNRVVQNALKFYKKHQQFMGRCITHLLTPAQSLNDITGWTAMQYENIDKLGSLIFVFRFVDNTENIIIFPKNLMPQQQYRLLCDEEMLGMFSGSEIESFGITVSCKKRYSGRILQIYPL